MLYKKSVKNFLSTKYSNQHYFSIQTSFDGKEYICNACNSKVKQGKVPFQAMINNMFVEDTPVELASSWEIWYNPVKTQKKVTIQRSCIHDDCVEDTQDSIPVNQEISSFQNQINDLNDSNDNNEETEDPLNEHRVPINQACLQSIIPNYPVMVDDNNEQSSGNEIYSIAAGENKHLFSAKSCLMSFV